MDASLLPLVRKYFETDHVAAAQALEAMSVEEAVSVIHALPPQLAAQAFKYLQPIYAAAILKDVPDTLFRDIVSELESQQGAQIFQSLPKDLRPKLLEYLPEKLKEEIRERLIYPEDSAGNIMTTNFLALRDDMNTKEAIARVRELAGKKESAFYAYVVDKENILVGIMNMRDMMLAKDDSRVSSVMRRDIFSVNSFMDRERVAEELSNRKYLAAPVVDAEGHMLGVIKADEMIQDVQEEATEDIQKMFGAGGDERVFSTVSFSMKKRLPWLYVNLATAFLAAGVISLFEDVIARITILAVFLPVVAGQGGNAGAQSLAVVMRGLVMREIPHNKSGRLIMKELWMGAISGLLIGVVTAGVAWVWQGNPYLGLVIGLAMIVNLAVAGLAGAAIPVMMKAVGLDPAQCSNIILTTITDVMGFLSFLGFAVLFQSYLL